MSVKISKNRVFDGYCERDFSDDTDGWMDEQLQENMVPSVQMAKDVLALYAEVNDLRRENWHLRKSLEQWTKLRTT